MIFNRSELKKCSKINVDFSERDIKNTNSLFRADYETAVRLGGDITRAALSVMNLSSNYKHIVVDTKTHMLMPGMFPAIPGWHTDGVPRDVNLSPSGSASSGQGTPLIHLQEAQRSPKYHLMVLGNSCNTLFLKNREINLNLGVDTGRDLYKNMTQEIKAMINRSELETAEIETGFVYEWDWWEIHTAQAAKQRGWRYLIRVTETDYIEPSSDLNVVMRNQQQVYVDVNAFGW